MQRLLQFLYRYRAFLLFLFLEILSFWLVVENNSYQGSKYFNSANAAVASISESSQGIRNFFDLSNQNRILSEENARLRAKLYMAQNYDSTFIETIDSIDSQLWTFTPAKVINKTLFLQNNYVTINKGFKDGIEKGMGVIANKGIAGQVVSVSENYASVASLLHGSYLISSLHKPTGALGTTSWDGANPLYANLLYLPRHLNLLQGDTIETSGYNTKYPPGTLIGTIEEISIADDATFYDIKLKLATDFYQLSHVYVVNYSRLIEKDSLELTEQQKYE